MSVIKDLGAVTAYGYAVDQGYTGTEAEFATLMASYASVAEDAAASATAAATSEDNAEAWAVGQINGTDVGSSDARYHNNSKYYSEQSANSAAEAAASAASLDVETILGDFATYEPEATAAYSHTKDKYLIWSDSKLYKVTANISVGDTIAKGTNIASNPTTVGDEVAALNSNLTNQATLSTLHGGKYFEVLAFANKTSISIDLGRTQTSKYFCNIVVFNANQNVMASISTGTDLNTNNYGEKSALASISGQTLTITHSDSTTLWGVTLVLVASSYIRV